MITKTALKTQRMTRNTNPIRTSKRRGDGVIDQHRDLEIERFLAVGVDLGRVAALTSQTMSGPKTWPGNGRTAEQGAGVAERIPGADVRERRGRGRRRGWIGSFHGSTNDAAASVWIQKVSRNSGPKKFSESKTNRARISSCESHEYDPNSTPVSRKADDPRRARPVPVAPKHLTGARRPKG